MTYEYQDCIFKKEGHIATFMLNRPERRNAFSRNIGEGLKNAIEDVRADSDIRVLVITGNPEGKAFCGGLDVKVLAEQRDSGGTQTLPERYLRVRENAIWGYGVNYTLLYELDKPTIAAVNGYAVGMGMDLALVCDIIIAAKSANFSQMYTIRGLIPDLGGFWLLPRLVGIQRAYELIYTGRMVGGEEAAEIGLALKSTSDDELMPATYELANRIAANPPLTLWMDKHIIQTGLNMSYREAMANLVPYAGAVTAETEDSKEGFRAAAEKRATVYTGK
jgi:enoyl-CoA hydratase/carnithine racemase